MFPVGLLPPLLSRSCYDVFLSFRGENFTNHIYTALCNAGFHTFLDGSQIQRDQRFEHQLQRAIDQSRISIIVFSRNYCASSWCLNELVKILERKKYDDQYRVFPVFYDVQPKEVGDQKGSFKQAFDKYEKSGEHSKETIDQWRKALKDVAKFSGKVLQDESNRHEAVFIQTIVKDVGIILKQTALSVASYTVGVKSRVKDIDLWIKDPADVRVGMISGMQGIGKTTIAKVAYNLNHADFEASSFVANIRESYKKDNGLVCLQSQLLSDILEGKHHKLYNADEGFVKIQDAIRRKRILVILDDVEQIEQVDALLGTGDSFLRGSKIIITTSHEQLLSHQKHKSFSIKALDNNESLQLFSLHAFAQDCPSEGYLKRSERLVRQCEGLPLALQVMGSSLFRKSSEVWASALENLEAVPDERVRKTLEVSYKSLHDRDKRLFLMIASTFVGEDKDHALKMLKESDFDFNIGMQNLVDRSLVIVDKENRLIMHQLVRDMAMTIIHKETTDDPGKHNFYSSTAVKTETITTEGSLLSKNDKSGKRKRLEDYEDESMPPKEERSSSFKRLCLGFFSLFEPPTRLTKLLTGQHR